MIRKVATPGLRTRGIILAAGTALTVTALSRAGALAVTAQVRVACKSDYFAHCSAHAVGSPGLRQCMRAVGRGLSSGCINALKAAGDVPKTVVAGK